MSRPKKGLLAGLVALLSLTTASANFIPWTSFPNPLSEVGLQPLSVAAGDFNEDGKADVVVANSGTTVGSSYSAGDVSVLIGNGDGTFLPQVRFLAGSAPSWIVVAKLNADLHDDLIVANRDSGDISVFLGNGDGTFVAQPEMPTGSGPTLIIPADFNHDARADIAVVNAGSGDVYVLLGNGDGSFTGGSRVGGSSAAWASVADFNRDGNEDLTVLILGDPICTPLQGCYRGVSHISVFPGNGDGTFGLPAVFPGISPNAVAVAAGQFNADGLPDVVVGDLYGNVTVLLGRGDGGFALHTSYSLSPVLSTITVGDFNGDGMDDLAIPNRDSIYLSVLLATGSGNFGSESRYFTFANPFSVILADLNGDDRKDMVVANSTVPGLRPGMITVSPSIGNGMFASAEPVDTGQPSQSIATGDFNNDGKDDLAVAHYGNGIDPGDVAILMAGADGFSPLVEYRVGVGPRAVVSGDFNGDGRLDLASSDRVSQQVSVLLGMGDGTFGLPVVTGTGPLPGPIAVGDFDSDGRDDLAVTTCDFPGYCTSESISIYLSNSNGSFFAESPVTLSFLALSAAVGDFDGDGHEDLVVGGFDLPGLAGVIAILRGNGTGGLTESAHYFPVSSRPIQSIASGDVNGDGHQDLILGADQVDIIFGFGDGTFGTVTPLTSVGGASFHVAIGDFNSDGSLDIGAVSDSGDPFGFLEIAGDGLGHFDSPLSFLLTSFEPHDIAVGDFDGDDRKDVAAIDLDQFISVLPNTGPFSRTVSQKITEVSLSIKSPLGMGSGLVGWTTNHELDIAGFNVVTFDAAGLRMPLNTVLIPCEECLTGAGNTYSFLIPKHKSGKNIFVEMVHRSGTVELFGPATKR